MCSLEKVMVQICENSSFILSSNDSQTTFEEESVRRSRPPWAYVTRDHYSTRSRIITVMSTNQMEHSLIALSVREVGGHFTSLLIGEGNGT